MQDTNNQENKTKMKHFEQAVDNGKLDHLLPAALNVKTKLHALASDTLKFDAAPGSELEQLQSILGMVHTLVLENRTAKLNDVLSNSFPEYYHPTKI